MINKHELMLNNFMLHNGAGLVSLNGWGETDPIVHVVNWCELQAPCEFSPKWGDLEPIEISPSVLGACGFSYIKEIGGYGDLGHCYIIDDDNKYLNLFCCRDRDTEIPCKYLHTLQNLIFAVSKRNLQIDIEKLIAAINII